MKIVTADELASILRLQPRTISRWLRNGVLPGVKLGGEWRIDLDMVSERLRRQALENCRRNQA